MLVILSSKWHESLNFHHKLDENGDCRYNQSGGIAQTQSLSNGDQMAFVELPCVPRKSCFLQLQFVVEVEEKTTFLFIYLLDITGYLFIRHC